MKRIALVFAVGVLSVGCVQGSYYSGTEITPGIKENEVPGTVNHSWAEPMYDTVRVPGQLDPTGIYYRPSHNTVVEIRPNRYQEVQYPDGTTEDNKGSTEK